MSAATHPSLVKIPAHDGIQGVMQYTTISVKCFLFAWCSLSIDWQLLIKHWLKSMSSMYQAIVNRKRLTELVVYMVHV